MSTKRKILYAEDDLDDFQLFKEIIFEIDQHVELVRARTGVEVFQYLDSVSADHLPSLIILDCNMPEMNGWQTLQRLKETDAYHDLPVVLFSTLRPGNMDPYEKPACVFRQKPCSFNELFAVAGEMLGMASPAQH